MTLEDQFYKEFFDTILAMVCVVAFVAIMRKSCKSHNDDMKDLNRHINNKDNSNGGLNR